MSAKLFAGAGLARNFAATIEAPSAAEFTLSASAAMEHLTAPIGDSSTFRFKIFARSRYARALAVPRVRLIAVSDVIPVSFTIPSR